MKTKIFLTIYALILILGAFGQKLDIELKFTATDSAIYVQLDSIKIMNRTQGGDTILYWPDTVLSLYQVGLPEISYWNSKFTVNQNFPNPFVDKTTVSLNVPESDNVTIIVTDILGRIIIQSERDLDRGKHTFRLKPRSGNQFFLTAIWRGHSRSITMIQTGIHSVGAATIEYGVFEDSSPQIKASNSTQGIFFSYGDKLLYIGYYDTLQTGMLGKLENSDTLTFQFATNIPCPGTPTVTYEGQVYNTIQIFGQCWLKENLNVGTMIDESMDQTDNGILEKYCYDNQTDSCVKYGGLYQWGEVMQYNTQQGIQGICPQGWHIPTDEEWKVLEGAVDSQYGIGDNEWDDWGQRGFDVSPILRTTSGWYENENGTDLYGFSGLPGGMLFFPNYFNYVGMYSYYWTSNEHNGYKAWRRSINYHNYSHRHFDYPTFGFSVRCLKD